MTARPREGHALTRGHAEAWDRHGVQVVLERGSVATAGRGVAEADSRAEEPSGRAGARAGFIKGIKGSGWRQLPSLVFAASTRSSFTHEPNSARYRAAAALPSDVLSLPVRGMVRRGRANRMRVVPSRRLGHSTQSRTHLHRAPVGPPRRGAPADAGDAPRAGCRAAPAVPPAAARPVRGRVSRRDGRRGRGVPNSRRGRRSWDRPIAGLSYLGRIY